MQQDKSCYCPGVQILKKQQINRKPGELRSQQFVLLPFSKFLAKPPTPRICPEADPDAAALIGAAVAGSVPGYFRPVSGVVAA